MMTMTQVRRKAKIIDLENKGRIEQLRELLKRHAGDKGYWRQVCAWRKELIALYASWR